MNKNLNKSRQFCQEVRELAAKYDLPFFIVTDGASAINNSGCEAIKHARLCHEKWEKEHNFDPNENWNVDLK